MKDLQEVRVEPATGALVIIDIQKEQDRFIRGEGFDVPNPDHERKSAIVPVVQGLAERARSSGARVIYTQSIRTGYEPEFTVFGRIPVLQVGTWHSEMVDELQPRAQDIVVRKWVPDPWRETDFERVFQGLFPNPSECTVLITGGSITGCAYFGVMGFHIRGYRVGIVTDGVYGPITQAMRHFSRTVYPTFPNIFLTRSDLILFRGAAQEQHRGARSPSKTVDASVG